MPCASRRLRGTGTTGHPWPGVPWLASMRASPYAPCDARRHSREPTSKARHCTASGRRSASAFVFDWLLICRGLGLWVPLDDAEHRSAWRGWPTWMSAKDRRAMDGPSDPCPVKREKRKAPMHGFTVRRRHRGGVLPLGYFSLDKQREVTRP